MFFCLTFIKNSIKLIHKSILIIKGNTMLILKETLENTNQKFRVNYSFKEKNNTRIYDKHIPTHVHDSFIEIEIVLNNFITEVINGQKYECPKGSVVILKPDDCHEVYMPPESHFITIHLLPQFISKELLNIIIHFKKNIVYNFHDAEAKILIDSALNLYEEYINQPAFFEDVSKRIIENICFQTMRSFDTALTRTIPVTPMQKAILYMQTTYMNNPVLEDVAKYVHLNPSYFSYAFKKHTGKTYISYINNLKLDYAKDLLCKSNMSITDICFCSGFGSVANFSRQFKAKFNITPSEMRKLYGNIKIEFYNSDEIIMQY